MMKNIDKKTVGAIVLISAIVVAEWKKGYFICPDCGYKFKPNFKEFILAPHIFTRRYFKCPHCNSRKLFIKDWDNNLSISTCKK